jgi:hypothetical protein
LSIVDITIKELFYRDDNQILIDVDEVNDGDEEDHHMNMKHIRKKAEKKIVLKCNVMKFFKFKKDNKTYTVDVPNNMCFLVAIDYVRCGMLFQ